MESFLSLLKKRRSIRKYATRPVPVELLEQLLKAVLWSPSSRDINPWEFIIVTDAQKLTTLARAKHGAAFLGKAPLAIAVIADTNKSDVWIEDASLVSAVLLFTAADLGLGACWIQIRCRMHNQELTSEAYVRGQLGIPAHYAVEAVIAIGYPAEEHDEHTEEKLQREKVHENVFGRTGRIIV